MHDDQQHDNEHFESVPWDALVDEDARRRRRWLAVVGGGLVVAALAFVVTGMFVDSGDALVPLQQVSPPAPPASAVAAPDPSTSSTAPLPTEADLSSGEGPEERAVGAFAAWFVSDYFTVDGGDAGRRDLLERLPEGVSLPPEAGTRSFVESALVLDVEAEGDGRYRVTVLVRHLVAATGEEYRRPPPRAAEVIVEVGAEGMAVVDLPAPVPLPDSFRVALDVGGEVEVPDHIAEAALAEAGTWGAPLGDVAGSRVGEAWRVVVEVEDQAGLTLPVAILLDDDGTRL